MEFHMRMPPPPNNVPTTKDRLFAWIGRHKLASAAIATVALITLLSSIGAATEGTNQAGPPPTATSSTGVIATPSESPKPKLAKVPGVMNLSVNQARSRLHAAGFIVLVVAKYSQQAPGTLLSVSADAGTKKKVGSSVSVSVAKSYPTVPYVIGLSQAKATSKLKNAGYNVVVNKQESSQTSGTVISVDPAAGTDRLPGGSVTIVVAKSIPPTCDPNYSGACVPIASDVDCAGGSGNGPAYVSGPVKVVGVDIYGLDGDGDGYGCE
jgi:resuscitation-promoting factor RpfB